MGPALSAGRVRAPGSGSTRSIRSAGLGTSLYRHGSVCDPSCAVARRDPRLATRLSSPGSAAEGVAAGSVGVMSSPVGAGFQLPSVQVVSVRASGLPHAPWKGPSLALSPDTTGSTCPTGMHLRPPKEERRFSGSPRTRHFRKLPLPAQLGQGCSRTTSVKGEGGPGPRGLELSL